MPLYEAAVARVVSLKYPVQPGNALVNEMNAVWSGGRFGTTAASKSRFWKLLCARVDEVAQRQTKHKAINPLFLTRELPSSVNCTLLNVGVGLVAPEMGMPLNLPSIIDCGNL